MITAVIINQCPSLHHSLHSMHNSLFSSLSTSNFFIKIKMKNGLSAALDHIKWLLLASVQLYPTNDISKIIYGCNHKQRIYIILLSFFNQRRVDPEFKLPRFVFSLLRLWLGFVTSSRRVWLQKHDLTDEHSRLPRGWTDMHLAGTALDTVFTNFAAVAASVVFVIIWTCLNDDIQVVRCVQYLIA